MTGAASCSLRQQAINADPYYAKQSTKRWHHRSVDKLLTGKQQTRQTACDNGMLPEGGNPGAARHSTNALIAAKPEGAAPYPHRPQVLVVTGGSYHVTRWVAGHTKDYI